MTTAESIGAQRANYERIQAKTFTNWINMHLSKKHGQALESFENGLRDGVKLIHLLEVISGDTFGKYVAKPTMRIQQVENVGKALKFIEAHDVKLVGTGAEEIVDGNLKMTLGLVWILILRFAIQGLSEEGRSAKDGLLLWCQRKTEPYDNVNVQDFSGSFQNGLAFCALIHRHRPDLIDYSTLQSNNALHNLNLAFSVAAEHLDVPKLLDAEDIVQMPRPDEKSIMTYVSQLYKVFSSADKVEAAGRRVAKFVGFAKSVDDMRHDYEERARRLIDAMGAKGVEFGQSPLGTDYVSAKQFISEFITYKTTTKREFVAEQAELATLFGNIQSRLRALGQALYEPPAGLTTADIDAAVDQLVSAERSRRAALNNNLRTILEALRRAFAELATPLADKLAAKKTVLSQFSDEPLDLQKQLFTQHRDELASYADELGPIEAAEQACIAANIEENEFTDLTHDDLAFEHKQLSTAFDKKLGFIDNQLAALGSTGVTAEQLAEFKQSFDHFDQDASGQLSRLEFKSLLSGLGLIDINFDDKNDQAFEAIFSKVSQGGEMILFDQYVQYMTEITAAALSPDQLNESFAMIAGNKEFVTLDDLRVAQLSAEHIDYLQTVLPPYEAHPEAYDHKKWLASQF
eukprot:TRINITY_DN194_c0_g1_i4.p1 TRINITY_DN194_c0_g1~~TRINITY_DN194_c0_g1_i4.p1  ORF type:complete len:632 (+),score=275.46 TRINITY_DN194_c0_g1_i4:110-2005(+)